MSLPIVRTVTDLRARVNAWRAEGLTVALVPTMGALHAGHLSLIETARGRADRVVASVFVNPAQFGPNEDYDRYPRAEEDDRAKLGEAGCNLMFAPAVEEMYPTGFATTVHVDGVSEGLCGAARPHFFDGVATVVTKLLLQCLPDCAVFGEKDYQQLLVIRRLAADLDIPVTVAGAPIVRESDGLALSSRNHYLSEAERAIAPALYRVLSETAERLADGADAATATAEAKTALLEAGFTEVDYIELRDAETLAPLERLNDRPGRLLAAAYLGQTRLIDNVAVG